MGLQELLADQSRWQPAELGEIESSFCTQRNTGQLAELFIVDGLDYLWPVGKALADLGKIFSLFRALRNHQNTALFSEATIPEGLVVVATKLDCS